MHIDLQHLVGAVQVTKAEVVPYLGNFYFQVDASILVYDSFLHAPRLVFSRN